MAEKQQKLEVVPPAEEPEEMPLPSDPKVIFLGGLFALALLAAVYVAAEIVLPLVLAVVLKLLLQPAMRLLERARVWYEPHLERIYEDAVTRRADLIQLEDIASGYPSRERFLTDLTLDPPDATSDRAAMRILYEDYLVLSTVHSAKGQEWKSVFVLNAVDGCIPSDLAVGTLAEVEEERRLLYVAMTRAKDDLHLVVPQRFFTHGQRTEGDRHVYAARTPRCEGASNVARGFWSLAVQIAIESKTVPAKSVAAIAYTEANVAKLLVM
jgi:UvrD-like helicase family protein